MTENLVLRPALMQVSFPCQNLLPPVTAYLVGV